MILDTATVVLLFLALKKQQEMLNELKSVSKKQRLQPRHKRPRRAVIVKKTHEREIVRVVPTSTEYMQQQYKRVAQQYANK